MPAENLATYPPLATLEVLAQAYGTSNYSSNSYNGSSATAPVPGDQTPSPTTRSTLIAPHTGFFAEPPIVTVPVLLIVALMVGTVSFAITRTLRQRRGKRP